MDTATEELIEDLKEMPTTSPPPANLVGVVNGLARSNAEVVTLDDLAAFNTGRDPLQVVRALRGRGWLYSLPVNGAWRVLTGRPGPHMEVFTSLRARLRSVPNTPACIGGRSSAQVRNWLRRPTAAAIGYWGEGKPPRCLAEYRVLRWRPRIPLDTIHGLPVWKPETLLAYMGVRPARFPWTDITEWLWEPCENVDTHLLAAELQGHPPAAWARTAYLLERGERPDAAADLTALGPAMGDGPHYFGRRVNADKYKPWMPVWSPKYKVVDYLLERNWSYDWNL